MITLPKLPYGFKDLEPHIDALTVEIHYGKHHQGYLDNLNKTISENELNFYGTNLNDLMDNITNFPQELQGFIKNQAFQVHNHNLYWQSMTTSFNSSIGSKTNGKIIAGFESIENFRNEFTKAGLGQFGSGWVWLCLDDSTNLRIVKTSNADRPNLKELIVMDVWEHAYYLKYQNRRAEYIDNFWALINWDFVESQL